MKSRIFAISNIDCIMATKKKEKTVNNGPALSPEWLIKERVRGLETGPCYCSDNFEEVGEGIVIVSRKHKGDTISFCAFLVDTYCLGLRRTFWEVRTSELAFDNFLMQHHRQCSRGSRRIRRQPQSVRSCVRIPGAGECHTGRDTFQDCLPHPKRVSDVCCEP